LRAASIKNLGALPRWKEQDARVAIIDLFRPDAPRLYTYGELNGLIDGVARFLTSCGLARGSRVAILSLNRVEYIATYLGIMRARMVAVPVNVKLPAATIEFVLKDSGVALMFNDSGRGSMGVAIRSIDFDDPGPQGFASRIAPARFDTLDAEADEVAQILYTSGSTGVPKGVPLTHSGMLWALEGATRSGLEEERQIVAQPLFHMNGLMVVKSVLRNGASIVVMPSFDAKSYVQALLQFSVTRIFAVPTMLARVLREIDGKALDFSRITNITLSSAPTTESLVRKVSDAFGGAMVDVSFGSTEAGPRIFGPHSDGLPKPILALGAAVPGCDILLEDNGKASSEGVLLVRNPAVMSGYLNLPHKTAEVLRDGWYRTGDVIRRDEKGFYYFVGRADDMFICSGENIYPGDVEKMLERHPAVQQAAVVPLVDEERGQMPTAFLVIRQGMGASVEEIRSFSIASGPAYQHPRRIAFLTELPLAGTNKIDRKALIETAAEFEREGRWSR
jgi:acyl-CoA synthetase (AMP-forming)/AMP-acid ligase II